jgi:ATP-dependent protease HslVU (ClpYQ) peptidase subunit
MTIVCGYRDREGAVWIGTDSRTTGGSFIFPEAADKIVRYGRWTLGHSGQGSGIDLLRRKGGVIAEARTPEDVAEILQALYKEADFRKMPDDNGAPDYAQNTILASADSLCGIYGDGSIIVPSWGFLAIGSGSPYAYGAAFALRDYVDAGRVIVMEALEAAAAFNSDCGGELKLLRVE